MGKIKLPNGSEYEFDGEAGLVSDMFHSFDELYEHRIRLFIALCNMDSTFSTEVGAENRVWASKFHHDGTSLNGWFIMGIFKEEDEQVTYHIPDKYWDEISEFAEILPKAPEWDGHTSKDVLERLKNL